ncbi:hypothetical protein Pmani_015822 [Petrolisthes manimaculis]|uniref:Uncharacterized protein n=1 Tax=Petrolisthes manimaculis TaxID=1843537 RepID=A0AAE1PQB4_9EUCA|nr:hypothetical protein Pmani_015822 [Petrolisthes manimaculis]
MLAITSAMSMGGGKKEELTANDKMVAIGKFVMEEDQYEARVKRDTSESSSDDDDDDDDDDSSEEAPALEVKQMIG